VNAPKPRVIVVIEGGVVSAIFSDQLLIVDVLDHDNWQVTDSREQPEEWAGFAALLQEIERGDLQPQIY
jgi:hypothetical protein